MINKTTEAIYDTLFQNDTDLNFVDVFPDSFVDDSSNTIYLLNGAYGFKITIERLNK